MIFNLFKAKPTLKELIPDGFVDIHSHILPGIDDGAKTIEESEILLNELKKIGFSKIYGTPHTYPGLYENTNESIKKSFNKLKNFIDDSLMIDYASEYLLNNKLTEIANEKKLLTIGEKFLLVEFNFLNMPLDFHEIIFNLQTNDISVILAHPERYTFLHNDFNQYFRLKKLGVYFQINLLSVVGYYGSEILKVSDKLLKNNLIDFVGSDVHNLNHIKNFSRKIQINEKEQFLNAIENNLNYFTK